MKTLDEIKDEVLKELNFASYENYPKIDRAITEIATRFAAEQTSELEHKLTNLMYIQKDNDDKAETIEQMRADILELRRYVSAHVNNIEQLRIGDKGQSESLLEHVIKIRTLLVKTAHYER